MTVPLSRHPTPSLAGVFDKLLVDIVSGRYPSGARLPAERDLARVLGASRPTLREALRRLGEWGLIEARRGSGIVVRELRDWSIDVLPTYLRLGAPLDPPGSLVPLVKDLLAVRRMVLIDLLGLVASRTTPGSLAGARAAARRAWESRHDIAAFQREDLELLRAILLSARFLPALWMLNGLVRVYLDLARTVGGALVVPEDYLEAYDRILAALERHDGAAACEAMSRYLAHHDRRLLAALGEPYDPR
jgi:GntR family transcriptional regulator, transcriptional repressor for pyruvate dehydrogenase complex